MTAYYAIAVTYSNILFVTVARGIGKYVAPITKLFRIIFNLHLIIFSPFFVSFPDFMKAKNKFKLTAG
jgi:hypothetical protein